MRSLILNSLTVCKFEQRVPLHHCCAVDPMCYKFGKLRAGSTDNSVDLLQCHRR